MVIYLDASAIMKLVLKEKESEALQSHLDEAADVFVTSAVGKVEVVRSARRHRKDSLDLAGRIFDEIGLVPVSPEVVDIAAWVQPFGLRSLDAFHVATAIKLKEQVREFITYDRQMFEAAADLGFIVSSPS